MSNANPYQAPQAALQRDNLHEVYDETSPFSPAGRFGRASYFAYALGMYVVVLMFIGISTSAVASLGETATELMVGISAIGYIAIFVFGIIFMIRRLHDLNWSGWLSVLTIVPIANLIIGIVCLFFPGTNGPNKFGPPPKPNRAPIVVVIIGLVFIIGILAAIAIPAYQDYVKRAQEMSQTMPQ